MPEAEGKEGVARVRRRTRGLIVIAAAAIALVVLAVVAIVNAGSGSGPERSAPAGAAAPSASGSGSPRVVAGPRPPKIPAALLRGSPKAPVTVVEFGDFACPYCGKFARDVKPVIFRRYVETGVVQFAWRDFPHTTEWSMQAAIAGRAAARQGRFWQYHDALYARHPEKRGNQSRELLLAVARAVGLNMAKFEAALDDPKLREAVEADYTFGQQLGMPGTPAFLVNGQLLFGSHPLSRYVKAIERARK